MDVYQQVRLQPQKLSETGFIQRVARSGRRISRGKPGLSSSGPSSMTCNNGKPRKGASGVGVPHAKANAPTPHPPPPREMRPRTRLRSLCATHTSLYAVHGGLGLACALLRLDVELLFPEPWEDSRCPSETGDTTQNVPGTLRGRPVHQAVQRRFTEISQRERGAL